MKKSFVLAHALLLIFCSIGLPLHAQEAGNDRPVLGYKCPPCNCPSDAEVFEEDGRCPDCSMALVAVMAHQNTQVAYKRTELQARQMNVAILVFPGVQIIDYAAPYEVFGQAGFNVFTVAETTETVTTAMNMRMIPDYTLTDHPKADLIVLPGGNVPNSDWDEDVLAWIEANAEPARYILTVCNGAFWLVGTDLLDGGRATTFYNLIDSLRLAAPNTTVVSDQRFVDSGKIVSTAGLTSGMDGSLHVIEKIFGKARAQTVALNLEYRWNEADDYARAALADRRFVNILISQYHYPLMDADGTTWDLLDTEGGRDWWTWRWSVETDLSQEWVAERIHAKLEDDMQWTPVGGSPASSWSFTEPDNTAWTAELDVAPENGVFLVTLSVQQTGGAAE